MTPEVLVGRDAEISALTGLINAAAGEGTAVVVLGEAGIGKSSLLRAAADLAREAGCQVLTTTGVEAETLLPFAGLHQLLRPILAGADLLPETQRRALLTAFGMELGPPPEPFLIALATLNLLADASTNRPIAVVADDVQWLDQPTHETLAFVARRISNDPIVVIGAVRKGHIGPFTGAGLQVIDLAGLNDHAARALLAAHAGDVTYAGREQILRESVGNPLALVELPAAWRLAGESTLNRHPHSLPLTTRLERAFAGRFAELSTAARDVILIAAIDAEDDLGEILAGATALAGTVLSVDAIEDAVAARLVHFDETRLRFRHPLVRSAVLQFEPISRRHAANAALAAVLENEPFRRTWHRAHAVLGPDDAVADELEHNHATSLRRGSVMSAIWSLERSAQLTTDPTKRGRRLLLAAEHAFGLGRADMVDQLIRAADATPLTKLDRARMEWLREIFNDGVPGDAARVLELCSVASESIADGDTALALNLLMAAALRCWWADAGPAARAAVTSTAQSIADVDDDPMYVAVLATADPAGCCELVMTLLDRVVVEQARDATDLRLLGQAAHAVGDAARACDLLGRAEVRLREQGRLSLLTQALTMQVLNRVEVGDWERATAVVEEGMQLARDTGQPIWDAGTSLLNAITVALRGDNERAQALAAEAERSAMDRGLNDLLACAQLARGFGWIAAGSYTAAYHELRRLFDPEDPSFHASERLHAVMFLAEAAVHCGQRDDARAVMADLEGTAPAETCPALRIHLAYARAVLADEDDAEPHFLAALRMDLLRWPWPRARLELAYGTWLRRQRRATESRPLLRSAQTTFDVMGAGTWAEQARHELRASGERPLDQETDPARHSLSAQEAQIARLAAEGLSNRDIGQRLYLSHRTVGSHLYRIFPKLTITSRAQLASRLDGLMSDVSAEQVRGG